MKHEILEELKLDVVVDTDEYIYGKSGYYGADIIINKESKKIYEISPCHDVCVCLIDIAQNYDNLDEFGFMMPMYIVNAESFETNEEMCENLFDVILRWEENPKEFLLKELSCRE